MKTNIRVTPYAPASPLEENPEQLVTVEEAAAELDIDAAQILTALETEKIPGTDMDGFWLLLASDARSHFQQSSRREKAQRAARRSIVDTGPLCVVT